MPLTIRPVFPVDGVLVTVDAGTSTDVGVVGEEELPPQAVTVPTTSSPATTSTRPLRMLAPKQDTEFRGRMSLTGTGVAVPLTATLPEP
ncbi:MAG: hypothetical protein CL484_16725 [Acidobacteria bacterium]|nr:hypothetical protein [Acidobacteriota bacterium]